jgi:hypothetical protein
MHADAESGMSWMGRREALDRVMLVAIALSGVCLAGRPVCRLVPGGVMACVVSPVAACAIGIVGVRDLARKSARYGSATRTAYAVRRIAWSCVGVVVLWQAIRWVVLTQDAAASCSTW